MGAIIHTTAPVSFEELDGAALLTITSGKEEVQFHLTLHQLCCMSARATRVAGEILKKTSEAEVVPFIREADGQRLLKRS
jgi:hypothetical protein